MSEQLVKVREEAKGASLAKTRPDEWMEIACSLTMGQSPTSLRKDRGGKWDYQTICRVKAEIEDISGLDNLKKGWALESATNINLIRNTMAEGIQRWADAGDLDDKQMQALNKALDVESRIHQRLRGEADVVTETRAVTDEDLAELKKNLLAGMRKADVIDVEDDG